VEALTLDKDKTGWAAADALIVACLINPDASSLSIILLPVP